MKDLVDSKITKQYSGVLLISVNREFILQRREHKCGISNPGLITTFGGVCEKSETHVQCAIREIREELDYEIDAAALRSWAYLVKTELDGSITHCEFFIYDNFIEPRRLNLKEGEKIELLQIHKLEIERYDLSPVCRQLLIRYITEQNGSK